jgi:brefeldin A-inhibited guanine nucleotide-exchange protein
MLAGVLVVASLETLSNSKETRKNAPLRDATKVALDALKGAPGAPTAEPRLIFEPLRLACETKSYPLMILALDCIGKLVMHAGHEASSAGPATAEVATDADSRRSSTDVGSAGFATAAAGDPKLADDIVNAVCGCFVETANLTTLAGATGTSSSSSSSSQGPEAVNLHILSVLISLILASSMPVHQTALLTAVRTVYNIFLLSRGHQTQMVAQGALGQIVGAVFGRVRLGEADPRGANGSARASASDVSSLGPRTTSIEEAVELVNGDAEDGEQLEEEADPRASGETVREARAKDDDDDVSRSVGESSVNLEVPHATSNGTTSPEADADLTPRPDTTPRASESRNGPQPQTPSTSQL